MGQGCGGKCPGCNKQAKETSESALVALTPGSSSGESRRPGQPGASAPTAGELIDLLAQVAPLMV